jgi:alanine-synthesizing transaminase
MVRQYKASKRASEMNYAIREIAVPADELAKKGRKLWRLNIGDPNKWDFETPEYFKAALREAVDRVDNGYGDSQGSLELRKAIVKREYEKHGAKFEPENVFISSGVSEGINMLMGALIDPGDEVLVPGPGYPSYMQFIKYYDGKVVPYRLIEDEEWEPDIDMLRARITSKTKAIVVINPNNPTGAVFSEKVLRQIGDIAAEEGLPVISDEIYDKITFGAKFYSMSKLSPDVTRIILNGFSKVNLMPGWRMGYGYFMDQQGMLKDVFEGMMKEARARICPNVPCQWAAKASLQGPQDYIREMNRKLKERADFSYKRLNEIPGISTNRTEGAFYMFPKVDMKGRWKSDKDFVLNLMEEEGVVLVHGTGFCEEFGPSHFRTITLPKVDILAEAYDKLERFMVRHQKK